MPLESLLEDSGGGRWHVGRTGVDDKMEEEEEWDV